MLQFELFTRPIRSDVQDPRRTIRASKPVEDCELPYRDPCPRVSKSCRRREDHHLVLAARSAYGTSPYRYLLQRRLDRARALIQQGTPLAEAAAASGFADQSHMTRHFKKAYGLAPGKWASLSLTAA